MRRQGSRSAGVGGKGSRPGAVLVDGHGARRGGHHGLVARPDRGGDGAIGLKVLHHLFLRQRIDSNRPLGPADQDQVARPVHRQCLGARHQRCGGVQRFVGRD